MQHTRILALCSLSFAAYSASTRADPVRHDAAPPAAAAPHETDDEIRARQDREVRERWARNDLEAEHAKNPGWDVTNEVDLAHRWLQVIHRDPAVAAHGADLALAASDCSAFVAARRAAKQLDGEITLFRDLAPGDAEKISVPVATVEAEICAPLAKIARTWDADQAAAAAQLKAKVEGPYRAVGITGAKLAFLLRSGLPAVTLGQRELETPAEASRASVFFVLLDDSDGEYLLERYAFDRAGNESKTEEGFLVRPGRDKYR